MSLLGRLVMGTKYGGDRQDSRDNRSVLYTHEPVGYIYFTNANISIILQAINLVHPYTEFADIQKVMVNLFHVYGASSAQYVNAEDERLVTAQVSVLNKETIREMNRKLGNNNNLHAQYQHTLNHPNMIPARPECNRIWRSTQPNPYYAED